MRALLETWRVPPNRGDLISNVALYIPFGFFWVQSLRRLQPAGRIVIVTLMGVALSTGIELAQFYDRMRFAGMADVYGNGAGSLIGAMAGAFFYRARQVPLIGRMEWHPYVFLLTTCWLGSRLFPLFSPQLPMVELYRQTVSWLAAAMLIETLFGAARSRLAMVLLLPAVLLARVLIAESALSPAEIAGGVLGVFLWTAAVAKLQPRALLIAVLFVGLVVLQALEPFHFLAAPRAFGWTPFLSVIDAPRDSSVRSFLEKTFTYGALIWLMARAGWSLSVATLAGAGVVLLLRFAQVYLPGRSAEITDAIMVLMLAGMMKLLDEAPSPQKKGRPLPGGPSMPAS